jgi:hypothetical protein
MSKLNPNRSITIGDQMRNGIDPYMRTDGQKEHQQKLENYAAKRAQKTFKKYGSIDKIREERMKKQLKDGWVKASDQDTSSTYTT